MRINSFEQLLQVVKGKEKRKIAVAAAGDEEVLLAVYDAVQAGIADFILVGDQKVIEEEISRLKLEKMKEHIEIIDIKNAKWAAQKAVQLVSSGAADVLMKGMVATADLLRAVLDKEYGLRTGRVLSHASIHEMLGRMVITTDGGMNIAPSIEQKADIIKNAVQISCALGVETPKVAVLAAVETVNANMPLTMEAAGLAKMAERGQIKGCIVDGPLAFDNAVSKEAAKHKGINSPVAGAADVLLVPNIEAGNMLGKSLIYVAKVPTAGIVVGAARPIVLTSRADTHEAKLYSIALSTLL